ncbi:MAG: hypothetical protein LBU90_09860 [Bacteroidales bacterium]|jgi:hypothetical protein|nr:hypothetical protein [Bacteroidales bacterium]
MKTIFINISLIFLCLSTWIIFVIVGIYWEYFFWGGLAVVGLWVLKDWYRKNIKISKYERKVKEQRDMERELFAKGLTSKQIFDYRRNRLEVQTHDFWEHNQLNSEKMEELMYGHNREVVS